MLKGKFTGLWLHQDFRRFWGGQTASMFGSQITVLALPLVAALILDATPMQMGILTAVQFIPFLVLSLFVGVWVDQMRRKPIMILADLGRALALAIIPIALFVDALSFSILYAVGLLVGIGTVFFDVAYLSYLPTLLKREELMEGNSKLELSASSASIAGQGLGGGLIQVLTAPIAILINSLAFLVSAIMIALVRKPEQRPQREQDEPKKDVKSNVWREIAEGTKFVFGNSSLRTIAIAATIFNLFTLVGETVFILFVARTLELSPFVIGIIFSMGGIGALLGAYWAKAISKRFKLGTIITGSMLMAGLSSLLVPLASVMPTIIAVILISVMLIVDAISIVVFNISQRSLRAAITPDHFQGRMNASIRFVVSGSIPIGALLGGALGGLIGTTFTLLVGALGICLASVVLYFSPVHRIREIPEQVNM